MRRKLGWGREYKLREIDAHGKYNKVIKERKSCIEEVSLYTYIHNIALKGQSTLRKVKFFCFCRVKFFCFCRANFFYSNANSVDMTPLKIGTL